ncbi:uncharacterized protein LOC133824973 [Humulus lupulus]|uniref:uncharacterized protein LOC133824973 n=1 Tax=Humulus lupulus TaxID=3486 RepID=UPI002B41737E|nr:uncharacterized protein LOC133824973 [Humulus lupulus]
MMFVGMQARLQNQEVEIKWLTQQVLSGNAAPYVLTIMALVSIQPEGEDRWELLYEGFQKHYPLMAEVNGNNMEEEVVLVAGNNSNNNKKYDFIDPYWDGKPYPTLKSKPIYPYPDQPDDFEEDLLIVVNQLKLTDSFHVDYLPKGRRQWLAFNVRSADDERGWKASLAAVAEFNRLNGADLKLSKVLSVLSGMAAGVHYDLTLQCTDGCFYEARIFMEIGDAIELITFRPAKHWPRPTMR